MSKGLCGNWGRRIALSGAAIALLAAGSAPAASGLASPGDFARIAGKGFALTVAGAFYADPDKTQFPDLMPNLGSPENTYSWSMAWFEDALWVGTNRIFPRSDNFLDRGPPEIWRYRPSSYDAAGDWGLSGTWKRVFQSPPLLSRRGLALVAPVLTRGLVPRDIPRDIGYRNMAVCNAGDGVERLYAASFGITGRILYYDGATFQPASEEGLYNHFDTGLVPTLLQLLGAENPQSEIDVDLGYRGLACFKGRVWTAPAGSTGDPDVPRHPVLHMNPSPVSGTPWQTVLDVSDPASSPLADLDNIGIFQLAPVGPRYLYLAVGNRTTGLELWRGDGIDCLEPWVGDGHCNISWAKIIDNGAGRPPDNLVGSTATDNSGATLGVYGNDLYVGAGESGVVGATLAELIRVPDAGSVPAGGADAPHEWQLIAGWPRRDYADPDKRLAGLENLDCASPGDMENLKSELPPAVQAVWDAFAAAAEAATGVPDQEPIGLDDDHDADDCLPASDAGPGFPQGAAKHPLSLGGGNYFWRFAEYEGDLFLAFAGGGTDGFDLLKSTDGVAFETIVDDGFGNRDNIGGRTLLATPIGLAVGTANIKLDYLVSGTGEPSSGTEVLIGTTAPGPSASPKADAGPDQLVSVLGRGGAVTASVRGSGTDSFGGGGLRTSPGPYEWFEGAVASDCVHLDPIDAIATEADTALTLNFRVSPYLAKTYTLRVTDMDGRVGCDEVRISRALWGSP